LKKRFTKKLVLDAPDLDKIKMKVNVLDYTMRWKEIMKSMTKKC